MKKARIKLAPFAPWLYVSLLAVGIPWYWPADDTRLLGGFPVWVLVAIVTALGGAILTAVLLHRPWSGEDGGP
jgi:hypothetical protein